MSLTMIIAGAVALIIVIALLIPVFQRANKTELLAPSETKPEWMREMPPEETVAATMADGEGITIYDYDQGEKLAAPFAEQIEDILRAKLNADPELAKYEIDFGTSEDHSLEIWVNEKKYSRVSELPDVRLREAFRSSVKKWNKA